MFMVLLVASACCALKPVSSTTATLSQRASRSSTLAVSHASRMNPFVFYHLYEQRRHVDTAGEVCMDIGFPAGMSRQNDASVSFADDNFSSPSPGAYIPQPRLPSC